MIFVKSRIIPSDRGEAWFKVQTDVTIKVDDPRIMVHEVKAVLHGAINDEHTDLDVSEQIAKILEESADELATHVKDLMEGEHADQTT